MNERIFSQLTGLLRHFRRIDPRWQAFDLPIKSYEQVRALPVSTRQDLTVFTSCAGIEKAFNVTATSGSTASRLIIAHSVQAARAHLKRLVQAYKSLPVPRGSLCLNLCSYDLNGGGRMMEAGYKGAGIGVIPFGSHDFAEKADELRRIVKILRPNLVNAYTNQLYDLFSILGSGHGLRVCVVNGEPLDRGYKTKIERMAGVSVFNHYGAMEVSGMSLAGCSTDRDMKVFADGLLLEVLKDKGGAALTGEGALLVTDLQNRSLPVIRYQLGDRVRLSRRGKALFIRVLGRLSDTILIDGEIYDRAELEKTALDLLGQPGFFFVIRKFGDTGKDLVTLRIRDKKKPDLADRVRQTLTKRFRFGQAVNVRFVKDSVPRTSTGKMRHLIDLRGKEV